MLTVPRVVKDIDVTWASLVRCVKGIDVVYLHKVDQVVN